LPPDSRDTTSQHHGLVRHVQHVVAPNDENKADNNRTNKKSGRPVQTLVEMVHGKQANNKTTGTEQKG
jgi:hypothetical protein